MLFFAFFVMAVLHFSGFFVLPLWLVFSPLILWFTIIGSCLAVVWWANK